MFTLFSLIKKNIKLLLRSKASALIIILGPLLVIFLVGAAFDNANTYGLNIGFYSEEYTDLTNSFISNLQEKEFKIVKYGSQDECVNDIKEGRIHACIIFPKDLEVPDVDRINEITYFVDYSRINLVWAITNVLNEKIEKKNSEISRDLVQILLDKLKLVKDKVTQEKAAVGNLNNEISGTKQIISNAQQQLNNIDLKSVNIDQAIISNLSSNLDGLGKSIGQELNLTEDAIEELEDEIKSASYTNASQKDEILAELKDVGKRLNATRNVLTANSSVDKTTLQEVKAVLTNANQKLLEVQTKVNAAITSTDNAKNRLNEAIQSVERAITMTNEVSAFLDSIANEIDEIKIKNATTIVNPIITNIKPVTSRGTHLNYLFPSLIVMVVMFISLLLGTTLVMMEKNSPAYFRNFITPTKDFTFVFSTYLTTIMLVAIQLVIIISIAFYFFKSQISGALPLLALALFLIMTIFTLLGMITGYLFTSEETATLASISIGSVFLFLSGVILPLEAVPEYLRQIVNYNPFVLSEGIIREIILFRPAINILAESFYLIGGIAAGLVVLVWVIQKLTTLHYLTRLTHLIEIRARKRKAQKA